MMAMFNAEKNFKTFDAEEPVKRIAALIMVFIAY